MIEDRPDARVDLGLVPLVLLFQIDELHGWMRPSLRSRRRSDDGGVVLGIVCPDGGEDDAPPCSTVLPVMK